MSRTEKRRLYNWWHGFHHWEEYGSSAYTRQSSMHEWISEKTLGTIQQVIGKYHIDDDVMTWKYIHGALARYVKLWVAHAPGMPGMFSPSPRVSDPGMHHGTCVTHVPWCMPGSLTGGFLWSRWREKRSRHSRCMRNPQFYVSGKRPMLLSFGEFLSH